MKAAPGTEDAWIAVAVRAEKDVRRLLGSEAPSRHTLHIRVGEKEEPRDPLRLSFAGDEFRSEIVHRIYHSLLCRAMFPAERAPLFLPSAEWMAAALAFREQSEGPHDAGPGRVDYGPLRASFAAGLVPLADRLLTRPVPPGQPILYQFYSMHCALLVDCIRSGQFPGEAACRRILELEAHGRDTLAAVEFVLRPGYGEGENLQSWYERAARDAMRGQFDPSPVDDIVRRVEECTTVDSVSMSAGADRITRMPIEELPGRLADYRLDTKAVGRAYEGMFALVQEAPVLLRDSLVAQMNALGLLAKGKTRAFARAMPAARQDFAAAVARQRAMEALLDRMQGEYSLPSEQLATYLHIVGRADLGARSLDPALHKLLDAAEN